MHFARYVFATCAFVTSLQLFTSCSLGDYDELGGDENLSSSTGTINANPDSTESVETPTAALERCPALPLPPQSAITLGPEDINLLQSTINNASANTTFLLEDGEYKLNGAYLWVDQPGITIRSASGNPDSVILNGNYQSTQVITVLASNVTLAEFTIRNAYTHAIHVKSSTEADTLNTYIYRVNVIDSREQAIKINPYSLSSGTYPDNGEISCSTLLLTDEGRPNVNPVHGGCYTGGIDAHQAEGWSITDNHIEGFWCANGLAEHAIHLWRGSKDTIIERNQLVNNARGVGLGLMNSGSAREFDEAYCPEDTYVGHYGGQVQNNVILADSSGLFSSASGFDCGICLTSTCGANVQHNTVASEGALYSSIEWRFESSQNNIVANNLVTHPVRERNGAQATATGNYQLIDFDDFVDFNEHDLHLTSSALGAIDQGFVMEGNEVELDYDQAYRDANPDIGAFEYSPQSSIYVRLD